MEWLRWIVLVVGLLVIGGIVWMYRRHRSEQAVDLGGGRDESGGYDDPIDASVSARTDDERAGARREPQLELGGSGYWSEPDEEGFVDGASKGRVVWRADDDDEPPARPEPRSTPWSASGSSPSPRSPERAEPLIEPEPQAGQDAGPEDEPEVEPTREPAAQPQPAQPSSAGAERPRPGFSKLFTRQGQQPQTPSSGSPLAGAQSAAERPSVSESETGAEATATAVDRSEGDAEAGNAGAVISMMIVEREQAAMPPERVRRAIEESGFEFGEFAIYHFQDLDGADWFSLMNAVSPGQFDPDDLSSFETPALALFMQLPVRGGADPSLVFERMHQVATSLAESLDAMLIDDRREPLDSESIDRYRELIYSHG